MTEPKSSPRFLRLLQTILTSKRLWYVIFGFFIFESVWYALSAIYPMAFDEDFHFGVIRIYSTHWLPFLNDQPPGADAFGAVARDPSYLYHYLMSFPYRLLVHFVHSQTGQVLVLRLLNVALFGLGIGLFRKLLIRSLRSPALVNTTLAVFVLIPVVPQLAAHINYDNLLFPLVAWTCLLVYDIIEQLRQRHLRLLTWLTLLNVSLLTSLVKYAYLPIFAVTALFLVAYAFMCLYRVQPMQLIRETLHDIRPIVLISLSILSIVSAGLFVQRYGINLKEYHKPVVDCDQVLDYDQCSAYGPWLRNYEYEQGKTGVDTSRLHYFVSWQHWLRFRLFFAINGPDQAYANYPPVPIPYKAALGLALLGLILVLAQLKRLFWRQPFTIFVMLASLAYLVALFSEDFNQYLATGQPVAINGRYLLPILPLLAIVIGRAFQLVLQARRWQWLKPTLAGVVLLCFLQGGGFMTFILRSDASWDWPNSSVIRINDAARRVLSPIIVEGSKYY